MLRSIKFKGRYFSNEANLEIFPDNNRVSIIYGKNGSGKSTITDAISKAIGATEIEGIEYAEIYDENSAQYINVDDVHVFNEAYVNSRVKVKEDGEYFTLGAPSIHN